MKNTLKPTNIWSIMLTATSVYALFLAVYSFLGGHKMDKGTIITSVVAIVVAIISLIGTIISNTKALKRDTKNASLQGDETRSAIKDVKADTSDAKPKIDNILEHSKETNEIVTRKFEPRLKEFEVVSAKINDIHKDIEYKQKLKNDVSPTLYDKDRFLGGIEKLYEENAKLTNENRNLKVELTDKELKLKSLEAELKVVREENKQLRTQLSPSDYNSSLTQEFTTE